ncbi:MAG TPA: hypothetical protein VGI16_15945 [Candidatus Acidoferrum sp.]|jgi:hypothetical protein
MSRNKIVVFLLFCMFFSCGAFGQIVDTSVCEILSNPQSFDGKIVRIKGTVSDGFEEFVIRDGDCKRKVNAIWLAYPKGTQAKAGPVALLQIQLDRNDPAIVSDPQRSSVQLDKNGDFKQFDSLLSTPFKAGGMCLGCNRYNVKATLIGRLDGVKEGSAAQDGKGRLIMANGFGNLNRYSARMVLQSVSDVLPEEIDYAAAAAATKNDSVPQSSGRDPIAAAHRAAQAFKSGTPAADQLERAAAAFGKEGGDHGVEVSFGVPNEVPNIDSLRGDKDSSDGLLFNCIFDADRLKGDSLTRAISHVGSHIADLRSPGRSSVLVSSYELEYRAWQTVVLSAAGSLQATLTLPGGYLVWNSGWPPGDRNKMMDDAITRFLSNWSALKNYQ